MNASESDMSEFGKLHMDRLRSSLICRLCKGYLIDATTLVTCMHSFCRSCIIRHVQKVLAGCKCKDISRCHCFCCPLQECSALLLRGKSVSPFVADPCMQEIVYKLVPNLYQNEMQRRREFYQKHPTNETQLSDEDRGVPAPDRNFYTVDDRISISLEYGTGENQLPNNELTSTESSSSSSSNTIIIAPSSSTSSPSTSSTSTSTSTTVIPGSLASSSATKSTETSGSATRRYLLCPANLPIISLKKFLKLKYDLSENRYQIELMYNQEYLDEHSHLVDVAYKYRWRQTAPLRLFYRICERPFKSKCSLTQAKSTANLVNQEQSSSTKSASTLNPIQSVATSAVTLASTPSTPTAVTNSHNSNHSTQLPASDELIRKRKLFSSSPDLQRKVMKSSIQTNRSNESSYSIVVPSLPPPKPAPVAMAPKQTPTPAQTVSDLAEPARKVRKILPATSLERKRFFTSNTARPVVRTKQRESLLMPFQSIVGVGSSAASTPAVTTIGSLSSLNSLPNGKTSIRSSSTVTSLRHVRVPSTDKRKMDASCAPAVMIGGRLSDAGTPSPPLPQQTPPTSSQSAASLTQLHTPITLASTGLVRNNPAVLNCLDKSSTRKMSPMPQMESAAHPLTGKTVRTSLSTSSSGLSSSSSSSIGLNSSKAASSSILALSKPPPSNVVQIQNKTASANKSVSSKNMINNHSNYNASFSPSIASNSSSSGHSLLSSFSVPKQSHNSIAFSMSSILDSCRPKTSVVTINSMTITSTPSNLADKSISKSPPIVAPSSVSSTSSSSMLTCPVSSSSSLPFTNGSISAQPTSSIIITSSSTPNHQISTTSISTPTTMFVSTKKSSRSASPSALSPNTSSASLLSIKQSPKSPNSFVITGSEDLHSCVTDRGIKIVRSPLSPGSQAASQLTSTPIAISAPSNTSSFTICPASTTSAGTPKVARLNGQSDIHTSNSISKPAQASSPFSVTSNGTDAVKPGENKSPASTCLPLPLRAALSMSAPTWNLDKISNHTPISVSSPTNGDMAQLDSLAKQHAKKSASINQIVNKIASNRIGKTVPVSATTSFPFLNANTLPKTAVSGWLPGQSTLIGSTANTTTSNASSVVSTTTTSSSASSLPTLSCSSSAAISNNDESQNRIQTDLVKSDSNRHDPLVIRIAKSACNSKPAFQDRDTPEKRPHSSNTLFTDDNDEDDDDDDDEGKLVLVIPDQSDHETSEFDESGDARNQVTSNPSVVTSTASFDQNASKMLVSSATNTPPSSSPDLQLKFGRNGCELVVNRHLVKLAHQNVSVNAKCNATSFSSNTLLGGTVSPPQTPSPKPTDSLEHDVIMKASAVSPSSKVPQSNNFGALDLTTGKNRKTPINRLSPAPISGQISSISCQKGTPIRPLPDHSIVS